MNWSITTITFRMRLYSLDDVVKLARRCGFGGIELWEPHWRNAEADLQRWREKHPRVNLAVLSGYVDLTGPSAASGVWRAELERKMTACGALGIPLLRLFTGTTSGVDADDQLWSQFFERLQFVEDRAEEHGLQVAFETHPGTLLDSSAGVERLVERIRESNWQRIGINFDAFHVWEFGADPVESLQRWYPQVKHVHFKNASGRTPNFAPTNVFSPGGNFSDLKSLSDGVVSIPELVYYLCEAGYPGAVTIEWFGTPDAELLKREVAFLNRCVADYQQQTARTMQPVHYTSAQELGLAV
jgi:3-dehydroshikimate dehydratase